MVQLKTLADAAKDPPNPLVGLRYKCEGIER